MSQRQTSDADLIEELHARGLLGGLLDPWRVDDLIENRVIPELQAIRGELEQQPSGDVTLPPDATTAELLHAIAANTQAIVGVEFNRDNLPIGMVGTAMESFTEGGEGDASFAVEGTEFITEVTTTGAVDATDPVQVVEAGNIVKPVSSGVATVVGAKILGLASMVTPVWDSTTLAGSDHAAQIELGSARIRADIYFYLAASGTIEVEVSISGESGTWRPHSTIDTTDADQPDEDLKTLPTGYPYLRAYGTDATLNDADIGLIELVAKGAGG